MSLGSILAGKTVRRLAGVMALSVTLSACYFGAAVQQYQSDPSTLPWWCDSTGSTGGHHHPYYDDAGIVKGELSWSDCLTLSAQFDQALAYAQQWPTLGDAEAAGMHNAVNYVAGMGTHHAFFGDFNPNDPSFDPQNPLFPGTALDDQFDPTKPEFLQYGGNSDNAPLVGMSWYVRTDDGLPPEGFVGDNDWWHVHEVLCFSNPGWTVIGEDLTDAQCAGRGGTNVYLGNYFMVHAWIVPGWEDHPDVFENHHPCLLPGGMADPSDPCWDDALG